MSERTRSIEAWVDRNIERDRRSYERLRGVHDGYGVTFSGRDIDATRGEGTIAHFIRSGEHDAVPLMRMNLPNQITIRRWREAYNIATHKGVQVIVAPRAVLDNADIHQPSIEVLHSQKRPRMFRPPQQVVQATVRMRYTARRRQAFFMSGYDLNERGLSYFFCELPPGEVPESVDHAYQLLRPESVKRALAQGRKVMRQGDMFFIKTRGEEGPPVDRIVTEARLFDTNHFVSELARHNGLVMVRGKVFHNPVGRRPDHAKLHLPGRGWWIAVRNTVPVVEF